MSYFHTPPPTLAGQSGPWPSSPLRGKPFEQVQKDTDRDYYMTAEEAKAYGVVDQIIKPQKS